MSKQPLVSISILNWNGLENTIECLKHLKQLNYKNYEVLVVDNGSTDGSKEVLPKEAGIIYIDSSVNTGFAGGHVLAAQHAKGEFLLLLNNDLVIDADWINQALATFHRHPKAAVVGGKQYKWNRENPLGNTSNEYFAFQDVNQIDGTTRTLLVGEEERPVDSLSGAALMIKTNLINNKRIGFLDKDFFAYYEETDLIARFMRAGYQAYYNPKAMAWHKVAASSEGGAEGAFYLYMMHRNRYLFAIKNFDRKYLSKFYATYRSEVIKSLFLYLLRGSLEPKMRIKAYAWLLLHRYKFLRKRKSILKLGPTYSEKIGAYKPTDVTVVIPCYNYAEFVGEAIESAVKQTLTPKQIIIINDGSTDNTQEVIDKYKNNPAIKIVKQKNRGIVKTKNIGISLSQTYWTIFLDADDVMKPDYIEKTVSLADKNKFDVVYTDMEYFGAVEDIYRSRPFNIFSMLQRNIVHNSALIKTTLLKQVGGYKSEMKDGLEDWELYLSLYEAGSRFGYLPEAIFKYRQHDDSLSRNIHVQRSREPELYQKLIDLHPILFRHMSHTRRRVFRVMKTMFAFIRNPYLFIVLVKSLPKAFVAAMRTSLHEVRLYMNQHENR